MVFFHGGGFSWGSGGGAYTPEYLLDHDVILVSGNYRLGVFGFLSLGTSASPGNYGLKDQVLLLKWVQENIAAFNGDPGQVTIFGQSAGSASVNYHLISPLSESLFHRAILQSGTATNGWAFDTVQNQLTRTVALAESVDCVFDNNYQHLIKCLREKSTEQILEATMASVDGTDASIRLYRPVAEPEDNDAFITMAPSAYSATHGLQKPCIIGYTAQEGVVMTVGK